MNSLSGKVALVTGGGRGIGAAIVRHLAREGAAVAFTYHASGEAAARVVADIRAMGRTVIAIQADSADPAAIGEAVSRTVAELGALDILVNNAGVMRAGPVADQGLEDVQAMIDVNLRAVIIAVQRAVPHLRRGGRIITIGSNLAERVPLGGAVTIYAATKAALTALTRGLARELGPDGIAVSVVQPGPTDTDMNPADGPFAEGQRNRIPTGRFVEPEEVAAMVAFLAGTGGAQVTGTSITLDGGLNA